MADNVPVSDWAEQLAHHWGWGQQRSLCGAWVTRAASAAAQASPAPAPACPATVGSVFSPPSEQFATRAHTTRCFLIGLGRTPALPAFAFTTVAACFDHPFVTTVTPGVWACPGPPPFICPTDSSRSRLSPLVAFAGAPAPGVGAGVGIGVCRADGIDGPVVAGAAEAG